MRMHTWQKEYDWAIKKGIAKEQVQSVAQLSI